MSKRMPFASAQNPCGEAQNDAYSAHSAHSHSVQQRVAGYNGPVTRSRVLRGHSSSSIIHSLPLEILGEILILALPTDRELCNKYDSERLKLFNPTLVLCAVCSSWRFLAFSTPQLWNTVLIHVPHNMGKAQAKRKAANLVQWIKRARSLPMTLHIFGDSIEPLNEKGPVAPVILVINNHAARWESLYLQDFQPSLSLFRFDRWHSLRRVYCPYSDPKSCANETAPWAYLTHLRIQQSIPCRDAMMIFMKCPKLVYLSILVDPPTFGQSSVTVPIVLEDLVTFHFRMNSVDSFQTLIHQLYLPSLREFSIDGISTRSIQPVLNLLTQSSCSLDTLEIRGLYLASGDYLNVLTHLSCDSLTSLTIRPSFHLPVDEDVLRRLTLHRNDAVCRHLTFLGIEYCIPASLRFVLLNMVESRVISHTSQVSEEPALRYLQLHVEYPETNTAELDEIGRRSGMEYSRERAGFKSDCFLVWFRRQGLGEPPSIGERF